MIVVFRIILEVYKAYRAYFYLNTITETNKSELLQYKSSRFIIMSVAILDEIILVMIGITSIMCIRNFGKGLKEMLIKQNIVTNKNNITTQLSESV